MDAVEFRTGAKRFLEQLFITLDKNEIEIASHWDIDHICYRAQTLSSYENLKKSFANFSSLLIESDVNGRPIATYRLHQPILFQDWQISLVELPAPKTGKFTVEGFEHIEVVCDLPFSELQQKYSHVKQDHGGLRKNFNAELELCFGEHNLKFHHLSLESVICLESNTAVWRALQNSQILEHLKAYNPHVAGTFPLGIHTASSDLDIILECSDFEELEKKIRHHWASARGFRLKKENISGRPSVVAQFEFEEVSFEVFAQDLPGIRQNAVLHFQIEERLLKYGSIDFKKQICHLRQSGLKTEPAFAKVLNIATDPYAYLLQLQSRPQPEIQEILRGLSI